MLLKLNYTTRQVALNISSESFEKLNIRLNGNVQGFFQNKLTYAIWFSALRGSKRLCPMTPEKLHARKISLIVFPTSKRQRREVVEDDSFVD
ncbi:CLUMA_CG001012, isoform A [Clunio marinus]|uniref:CLUMA_CG001012, isoform A n=1 Tax=Clunio marinus TaxID=568069 RepID=A0A1J1HGR4_9DIPT|nr:CLUMA_CG001012, isoform A [Clunio marinus]